MLLQLKRILISSETNLMNRGTNDVHAFLLKAERSDIELQSHATCEKCLYRPGNE